MTANPASPRETDDTTGTKLGYALYSNAGTPEASFLTVEQAAVIGTSTHKAGILQSTLKPGTTGGLSIFRSIDIDESEEEVKGTAGQLYVIHAMNMTAAVLYLKFYNATAASVTVGSTTPVLTFPLPTLATTNGAGFVLSNDIGWAFGTAITVACTTALADADSGAPGANACIINLGYK
jgi:hypothetical protein